ncbi:hypothetical protein IQ235_07940 [Oscillatoriales cyanobacterium LEGE 11467]|uniref:Uncharacterized protein n=1 Tax=Zarconia navalis LEGE 11467 TaxID=1828826 RepID=A0A928VWA1_9CYAN|nr:hypothetical protein [Zarconia navalis]MBE9040709.1 hypothetical protein [Zarconia navalis LEGE 11467]
MPSFPHRQLPPDKIMLELEQYPREIARIQRNILDREKQIRRLSETLSLIDNQIDRAIAYDDDLRNDSQRKAKRNELRLEDLERSKVLKQIRDASDRKTELEIDLEYYRCEYKIRLLMLREKVAQLESAA